MRGDILGGDGGRDEQMRMEDGRDGNIGKEGRKRREDEERNEEERGEDRSEEESIVYNNIIYNNIIIV